MKKIKIKIKIVTSDEDIYDPLILFFKQWLRIRLSPSSDKRRRHRRVRRHLVRRHHHLIQSPKRQADLQLIAPPALLPRLRVTLVTLTLNH